MLLHSEPAAYTEPVAACHRTISYYKGADKFLARPGRKQANVSDVLLTVHLRIILVINQLDAQNLNKFIKCLYMFRVLLCSSSGGQNCIIQHLVSSLSAGGRPVHRLVPVAYISTPLNLSN